jgi:hypothetical protein
MAAEDVIEMETESKSSAAVVNNTPIVEAIAMPDESLQLYNIPKGVAPLVRRIYVMNPTQYTFNVIMTFTLQHNPNVPIDVYLPQIIYLQIKPKSNQIIHTLLKNNPNSPWIDYTINTKLEYVETQQYNQQQYNRGYTQGSDYSGSKGGYYNRGISDEEHAFEGQNQMSLIDGGVEYGPVNFLNYGGYEM